MNSLFKISVAGAAIFFSSFSLVGEDIKKVDFETHSLQSAGDNSNLVLRKKCSRGSKKEKNKKYQSSYFFLRAPSFDVEEDWGVTLVQHPVNIQGIRTVVQALKYPNDFDRPKSSATFEIPEGYKEKLASAIDIPFRTPSSVKKIKGDVKFSIIAKVKHLDGSSSTINLGKKTKKHVKTVLLSRMDESRGKPYMLRFKTSGKFLKGDIVTLMLKRINSDKNNFNESVYIPSLVFNYNIE